MGQYMVTNQHQPEDCPELADELSTHYEGKSPEANVNVYCNCGTGEHLMYFLVEADSAAKAMGTVPAGFLRSATTVTQVEEAYKFATGAG